MSSTKLIRVHTDPLNNRLTTAESKVAATERHYAKPIKGIVSNTSGLVTGDRYILTTDITKIKTIGGADEDFADGATVSVINSSKTYLRRGSELLERDPLIRLTGTVRFYIATTGSNTTGDGTATKPWATLGFALNAIARKYIFQGVNLFITCGDGVYTSGLIRFPDFATAGTAFNQLYIEGNTSNPEAVEFQSNGVGETLFDFNTFVLRIFFKNITIRGVNLNQDLIRVFNSPYFYLDTAVVFKGQFRYGLVALSSADISSSANAQLILKDVNCTAIAHANRAYITLSPGIISVPTGTSVQCQFLIEVSHYSTIFMSPNPLKYNIQGTIVGQRFKILPRGQIFFGFNANPTPLNFLPGSTEGTIDPGGVYDLRTPELENIRDRLDAVENPVPNIISLDLNASTWTTFSNSTVSSFKVLSSTSEDLTDSFNYRQTGGSWQIFSLTSETNLQIYLYS